MQRDVSLFRLYTSESLIGSEVQFFQFALIKVPNLGLQRRLRDRPHLER